jgi:hypothetical protein
LSSAETGGLIYATTRNRTLAVGKRIEEEIRGEIDHPRVVPEPAERMVVGIDGAFVKAGHTRPGQRHQFEILTGRIEASQFGGEAFAVVRDLDPYAKRRVQAILRRCGRGQNTDLRILSDGEDGLRGVVGTWFGKKCEHRLDWFHVARRIARIEKEFLYLPYGDDFQERLSNPAHTRGTSAPSFAAGIGVVPSPQPRSRTLRPFDMPKRWMSASPLSRILSAMRVKFFEGSHSFSR